MNKIRPTEKQKRAFNLKKENPERSYKDVMLLSGYSSVSAEDPKHNLTETRGYQQLLDNYKKKLIEKGLDEEFIANKLQILSNSSNEDIQIKALDRIIEGNQLRVKNSNDNVLNVQNNYHLLSTDELNKKLDTLLQDIARLRE